MVLSVFKQSLFLNTKFVTLLSWPTTLLSDTNSLHQGASIAGDFIQLEVSRIYTPRLKAIREAIYTEVNFVKNDWLITHVG